MANLIAGEPLRVLLVAAQESMRGEVEQALEGRAGDYRLYWVAQAGLAPARGQEVAPQVVLVDDDLGGANPVSLIGQLTTRLPGSAVVGLVNNDGMSLARQEVLAGARGFVTKPLLADDLVAALRQVLAHRQGTRVAENEEEPPSGKVIVFCAPKGGTGRSMVAVNTAICLRKLTGSPVAVVDADFAAPALDVALNLPSDHSITDLLPKLSRLDRELIDTILPLHASHIRVLLAPPPADLSNPVTLPQVQAVLVWLKRMFDYVVVDLGLPMDETAYAFLDSADRIVMTLLPEMIGLRNTRPMLDEFRGRGYPEDKVWLVLNRASLPGGVPLHDIEDRLQVRVRCRVPDDQALVTHSINRGVPVVISHGRSSVARAIESFARDLLKDMQAAPEADAESSAGVLARLRNRPRPAGA